MTSQTGIVSPSVSDEASFYSGSSHSQAKYDILTVFQASPLGYFDENNEPQSIGTLDFDLEKEALSDVVRESRRIDAHIELAFEIATTDKLGAFLARGECEVLHFSCHGHKDYLFVEDGFGGGYQLLVPHLQNWIAEGGRKLRFVFVSACHSRSAGEGFLKAGVPHVVCCQHDNQKVGNTAAIEFSKSFYRNLICGKSLKEAFDLGRHEVLNSWRVANAHAEMNKFVLLPEDVNHDVPVFFTRPRIPNYPTPRPQPITSLFPLPPQIFLGRNLEMFRVLHALKESRLVRVTGPSGSGKSSVVKAVCQYICKRDIVEDIFWIPGETGRKRNNVVSWISQLCEEFQCESKAYIMKKDSNRDILGNEILEALHAKKVLLIIDARKLVLKESIANLLSFLEDLFQRTLKTKVIMVHRSNEELCSRYFSVIEEDILVRPLDFKSSISLFCCHCRLVTDPKALVDKLVAQHEAKHSKIRYRTSEMLRMIDNGIPAEINNIARSISQAEYDRFISLSNRPVPVLTSFRTRASLELRITALQEELDASRELKEFHKAAIIQESLDDLRGKRESFPDLPTLRMMAEFVSSDLDQAIYMEDYDSAGELQNELDLLVAQINLEEEDSPVVEESKAATIKSYPNTRIGIEKAIQELEMARDHAWDNHNFIEAKDIDQKLILLNKRKESFPSSVELQTQIRELKYQMKEAKLDHNWDPVAMERLDRRVLDLEDRLKREKEAEKALDSAGISRGAGDSDRQLGETEQTEELVQEIVSDRGPNNDVDDRPAEAEAVAPLCASIQDSAFVANAVTTDDLRNELRSEIREELQASAAVVVAEVVAETETKKKPFWKRKIFRSKKKHHMP